MKLDKRLKHQKIIPGKTAGFCILRGDAAQGTFGVPSRECQGHSAQGQVRDCFKKQGMWPFRNVPVTCGATKRNLPYLRKVSYFGSKRHSTRQDCIFNISTCKNSCAWKPFLFPLTYAVLSFRRLLVSLQLSCFADGIRICLLLFKFPTSMPCGLGRDIPDEPSHPRSVPT